MARFNCRFTAFDVKKVPAADSAVVKMFRNIGAKTQEEALVKIVEKLGGEEEIQRRYAAPVFRFGPTNELGIIKGARR